jgi:hypothetical protein
MYIRGKLGKLASSGTVYVLNFYVDTGFNSVQCPMFLYAVMDNYFSSATSVDIWEI